MTFLSCRPGGRRPIDKELGEKAFDSFFELERELSELFDKRPIPADLKTGTDGQDLDMYTWVINRYEEKLREFPEDERDAAEDIFWGMVNYLKFHEGDDIGN